MYVSQRGLAPPSEAALDSAMNVISAFTTVPSGAARSAPHRERAHVLPPQPTLLFDREVERATMSRLLDQDDVQLVTLTGPGGVGKTHLALAVAESLIERFRDGVRFVDLTPFEGLSEARASIADALTQSGADDVALSNESVLSDEEHGPTVRRSLLLVLDNCEHLLPRLAREVAALLAARTDIAILATSREALRLRCEYRVPIQPLALPAPDDAPPEALLASPAVALFVARARSVRPDFALTSDNGPTVAALCRRLDGLPLAIELIATRLDLLSPAALLNRLERRLPLPTRGAEDAPPHHRSLEAVIGWSYEHLAPAERTLLRRLAGLHGHWTLGQAEAIADEVLGLDALTAVLELVDKGLVVAAALTDEPRFALLQTVRAYVTDPVVAADHADEAVSCAVAVSAGDMAVRPAADSVPASPLAIAVDALRTTPQPAARRSVTDGDDTVRGATAGNPLSPRERDVLRLVADGLPSKQIGRELGLAERTVKAHVTGAMNKLGAFSRAQALAIALRLAYI